MVQLRHSNWKYWKKVIGRNEDMIDKTYNQGFDGEKEVVIYNLTNSGKEGYEIWEGYFDNLLDGCYHDKIAKGGILYGYKTLTRCV